MFNKFVTQKPHNHFLSTLVDYYFFIDQPIEALFQEQQEYIIPFPRITFGYFFEYPFMATNHDLKASKKVDMVISRVSAQKITVIPLTDRIKIIGAHTKPYILAYLTKTPINQLPWLIDTMHLFGRKAHEFKERIKTCSTVTEMFDLVEKVFMDTLLIKDTTSISNAMDLIEKTNGDIKISEIAEHLEISVRALRMQFQRYIGCSPKEVLQLVRLKKSIQQMDDTNAPLTKITYENSYFDQPHFINSFKKITGKSPKNLRREMDTFRFLQF